MKALLTTLLAALALVTARANEGDWLTNFPDALAKAKKENKLVLLDFNGSDWCPPCMAIKKNVFASAEFKKYAKDNLVLVDVDFPKKKKQDGKIAAANEALMDKFKVESFPTILLVDADGKQVHREEGYDDETPMDYIAKLKKLRK